MIIKRIFGLFVSKPKEYLNTKINIHLSLTTQTRRVTTRSQTYRECRARRFQDNMDGANSSEPTASLQSTSLGAPTTRQHVPRLELSALSVFSTPETDSFQHMRKYAPA